MFDPDFVYRELTHNNDHVPATTRDLCQASYRAIEVAESATQCLEDAGGQLVSETVTERVIELVAVMNYIYMERFKDDPADFVSWLPDSNTSSPPPPSFSLPAWLSRLSSRSSSTTTIDTTRQPFRPRPPGGSFFDPFRRLWERMREHEREATFLILQHRRSNPG